MQKYPSSAVLGGGIWIESCPRGGGGDTRFPPIRPDRRCCQFPHLCLGDGWYFGEEHTPCLDGSLAILADWGDLFGHRLHVFWEAVRRCARCLGARYFRTFDAPRGPP